MYSYEDASKASLVYFCGDELAANVFLSKYALRDNEGNLLESTPDEMHARIARELARIEKSKFRQPLSEAQIFDLLKDFQYIIPQGSPMYGIGNPYQYVTLSNCYVLSSPSDSYAGILSTDEELVQISKRRGGVGIDISNLRPAGAETKNASRTSTGIVTFMERYSNSIREVGQAGRRGALLISVSVHHPQVLDFARAKLDKTKVTGANISIRLTDEFLNAVEDNKDYEQRFPVDSKSPQISKKVNAREIWKEIIKCAHGTAEPGLLFWDTIIRESPADCYSKEGFRTISCNPCQPLWAKLLTPSGIRELRELNVGDEIWSSDGWTKITKKWKTGIKPVYEFKTTAGCFYGTKEHEVLSDKVKIQAGIAENIDIITGPYIVDADIDTQDIIDGLVVGDGSIAKQYGTLVILYIGEDDQDYFDSEISNLIIKHLPGVSEYAYEIKTTIYHNELDYTYNRKVPERFIKGNKNKVIGFLRGLYSANGSICGGRVTLKAASFHVIEAVQMMLSSIGISSYYTTNKPSLIKWHNGEYISKQSYDLNIFKDRSKFLTSIGFIQNYKQDKLAFCIKNSYSKHTSHKYSYDIVSRQLISEEEVWDIEVDNKSHTYWTQCCNVSNCAELPLCKFDSCRLLLLNTFSYVVNPFTKNAHFDFTKYFEHAKIAQRLMDDIVDLELECIDRIIQKIYDDPENDFIKARELNLWKNIHEKCYNGRRTGTGITALGDTLAGLGLKYDSDYAIKRTGEIYKTLKLACYRSSVEMAEELGSFPIWEAEAEKNNPFLLRIKDDDPALYSDMQKYGRRNIALLTTAPAGSVSILAGPRPYFQRTSGIEPLFQESFTRRKKINPSDDNVRIDFRDQNGDCWQEFKVEHSALRMWKDITGESDDSKSPYHNSCAEQLDWKQRIKLQATAGKHVDHSISSTLNLPEDVTIEKVAEIYETAWKLGLKGITVYRKNCRTGVLIDNKPKEPTIIIKTQAPKRPKILASEVFYTKVKGVGYFVVVGLLNGEPYEVFAGRGHAELAGHKYGFIEKVQRRVYVLWNDKKDAVVCKDIVSFLEDEEEAITRLVSISLRHGSDIAFITHQLEKTRGDLYGFAKGLARVLKKYIKDGQKVSGEACPVCKQDTLLRNQGCPVCSNCGYSKCT